MELDEIKAKVGDFCAGHPAIAACYIYGSYAAGKARPDSDIDVAFLLDASVPSSRYSDLRMDYYCGLSSTTRKESHVLIMNDAGELVLGEVLREGVKVFVRDEGVLDAFIAWKIPLIAEFTYYSELFRRKLVERYGEADNG